MIVQYVLGPGSQSGELARQFDGPIAGVRVVPLGKATVGPDLAATFARVKLGSGGAGYLVIGPVTQTAEPGDEWDRVTVSVPTGSALVEIADGQDDAHKLARQSVIPATRGAFRKLLSQTGLANTAFTTAILDVSDLESIGYRVTLAGGAAPAALNTQINGYDLADTGTIIIAKGNTITTGALSFDGSWGPGCTGTGNGGVNMPAPLPGGIAIVTPAFGVGIVATLHVYGRER
jgi:hypothetical protein